MATQNFSKSEAIRFGWDTMKKNLGFFIGLFIGDFFLWIAISLFFGILSVIVGLLARDVPILLIIINIIIGIAYLVLIIVNQMGLVRISLKLCDQKKGRFSDLFSFSFFFGSLLGTIFYTLIVLVGLILLIVPGIIWAIKFSFYEYFIIDKGAGPLAALKMSAMITKGAKWNLFIFTLLLLFINVLGFICLFIGLFATIPTTMIAMAFVYRKLLAQPEIEKLLRSL